ncbi:PIG-X protein [Lobosporangium transversale]|uniref:Protein PBN1 n=1 Tax=Lobosporangium transversale TaxID=64571 RepID=A0A1Y2G7P6_9FUNG|nr:PIG-X protein [Lobosporangium transversale]ORZ00038.1 PIG-X protein [Lobosporangium transversale]|eukprot:XP_021876079.1 PIG-X protein [Lobosporangium transversale]
MSLLISGKQHQSGSLDDPPALIDMVLSNGDINIKMIWPATGNSVQVSFNEQTDIAVEVGWFYREVTEQENTIYDHYLGATVKMEAQGEVVSEALLQTRSPVFPPHKREASTKEIKIPGHGFSSTMSPAQTLHPHSITTIQSNPYITDTTAGCELQVLHVLPPGIFVDPFQLEGLAPEIGEVIVFGETDLEKPVGVVSGWGSLVMVKVQPENSSKASRWIAGNMTDSNVENKKRSEPLRYSSTVDIPMHMRYQPPVSEGNAATHVDVLVPWPLVAWVCPVSLSGDEEASATAAKKLFHIPPLPLNLLFGFKDKKSSVQSAEEGYNFRFLLPDLIPSQYPVAHVSVPVGRLDDLSVVRTATFALAGAGTLAVVWALVKAVLVRSSAKGKMD